MYYDEFLTKMEKIAGKVLDFGTLRTQSKDSGFKKPLSEEEVTFDNWGGEQNEQRPHQ